MSREPQDAVELPENLAELGEALDKALNSDGAVSGAYSAFADQAFTDPAAIPAASRFIVRLFAGQPTVLVNLVRTKDLLAALEHGSSELPRMIALRWQAGSMMQRISRFGESLILHQDRLKNPAAAEVLAAFAGLLALNKPERASTLFDLATKVASPPGNPEFIEDIRAWLSAGQLIETLPAEDRSFWQQLIRKSEADADWSSPEALSALQELAGKLKPEMPCAVLFQELLPPSWWREHMGSGPVPEAAPVAGVVEEAVKSPEKVDIAPEATSPPPAAPETAVSAQAVSEPAEEPKLEPGQPPPPLAAEMEAKPPAEKNYTPVEPEPPEMGSPVVVETVLAETAMVTEPVPPEKGAPAAMEPVLPEKEAPVAVKPVLPPLETTAVVETVLAEAAMVTESVPPEKEAPAAMEPVLPEKEAPVAIEPVLPPLETTAVAENVLPEKEAAVAIKPELPENETPATTNSSPSPATQAPPAPAAGSLAPAVSITSQAPPPAKSSGVLTFLTGQLLGMALIAGLWAVQPDLLGRALSGAQEYWTGKPAPVTVQAIPVASAAGTPSIPVPVTAPTSPSPPSPPVVPPEAAAAPKAQSASAEDKWRQQEIAKLAAAHPAMKPWVSKVQEGTWEECAPLVSGRHPTAYPTQEDYGVFLKWLILDPPRDQEVRRAVPRMFVRVSTVPDLIELCDHLVYAGSPNANDVATMAQIALDMHTVLIQPAERERLKKLAGMP